MRGTFKSAIRNLLPRRYRAHQILTGPLRGLRIVASWRDYPSAILGYNERALLSWMDDSALPGETWLDIGGHYGYTTLALSKLVGAGGRVFTFEPTLSTAGCVEKTVLLNSLSQVTVVPMGLGARPELELRRTAFVRGMADSTVPLGEEQVTIFVASLDWLWPQICGANPQIDGVKIDVQGMEVEVIRGMTELLRIWKPKLTIEMHSGVDRESMLQLLEACGYGRDSKPVEPMPGEVEAQYHDDRSYAFSAR